jgi:hypothetical protein
MYCAAVWWAIDFFFVQQQEARRFDRIEVVPGESGMIRFRINGVPNATRSISILGRTVFEYSIDRQMPERTLSIWLRNSSGEFYPSTRVSCEMDLNIDSVDLLMPARDGAWMLNVDQVVTKNFKIGPLKLTSPRFVSYSSGPINGLRLEREISSESR